MSLLIRPALMTDCTTESASCVVQEDKLLMIRRVFVGVFEGVGAWGVIWGSFVSGLEL